jgi:hypothetical protein
MNKNLLILLAIAALIWIAYTGFSSGDDSPMWDANPHTRMNSEKKAISDYAILPEGSIISYYNEPQFINSPQGVFVVNTPIRPVPRTLGMQSEVMITRHPSNHNIIFGSANTTRGLSGSPFSVGWYVSTNGGSTWFGGDTIRNSSGLGLFNYGEPAPVIDKDGVFIESFLRTNGSVGASYSTNNGVNWANIVAIPGATTSSDKNFSGTNDVSTSAYYGRSYTAYTEFAGTYINRILGSYTTNSGASWTSVTPISPPPSSNHFHQGCDIKCGPNGDLYVVWANSVLTSPFTEDSIGFAKSTNGGVNWVVSRNNAFNVNGNRTSNIMNNIRTNGFPRIDIDRTCGPRQGWIYVVVGEKNPGVAGDISDVTLYSSSNDGVDWSNGVRVNQDAFGNGKKQYLGAVRVDESGGVNVLYYDSRNIPTNDSVEVWLSRSTDGGNTWTDFKVGNKFKHGPTGLPNVSTQYAGDFIGITSTFQSGNPVNGNQRIWPFWHDNSTGIYQAWTAKVEILPTNPCWGCEDFSDFAFTPNYFHLEFTGNQYWTRQTPSAYGIGAGSAKFDFFNAPIGTQQSLLTKCEPTLEGQYLTFDQAYAPHSTVNYGPDTLDVEASTNGGNSYIILASLLGLNPSGGELNTAPPTSSAFVPTSSQWRSKIYSLPIGTNAIRLRAKSGFGNNLFIDNVCIQSLANPVANTISIQTEGLWRFPNPPILNDTFMVYLHRIDFPNIAVDSVKGIIDANYVCSFTLLRAESGNYYKVAKHRNSIVTWSKSGGELYTRGANTHFNFLTPANQSYGNNMKFIGNISSTDYYAMYSGDVNQDKVIDGTDVGSIDNDAANFQFGYLATDLNGDSFVDGSDFLIADNNAAAYVSAVEPAGTEPETIDSDTAGSHYEFKK